MKFVKYILWSVVIILLTIVADSLIKMLITATMGWDQSFIVSHLWDCYMLGLVVISMLTIVSNGIKHHFLSKLIIYFVLLAIMFTMLYIPFNAYFTTAALIRILSTIALNAFFIWLFRNQYKIQQT